MHQRKKSEIGYWVLYLVRSLEEVYRYNQRYGISFCQIVTLIYSDLQNQTLWNLYCRCKPLRSNTSINFILFSSIHSKIIQQNITRYRISYLHTFFKVRWKSNVLLRTEATEKKRLHTKVVRLWINFPTITRFLPENTSNEQHSKKSVRHGISSFFGIFNEDGLGPRNLKFSLSKLAHFSICG